VHRVGEQEEDTQGVQMLSKLGGITALLLLAAVCPSWSERSKTLLSTSGHSLTITTEGLDIGTACELVIKGLHQGTDPDIELKVTCDGKRVAHNRTRLSQGDTRLLAEHITLFPRSDKGLTSLVRIRGDVSISGVSFDSLPLTGTSEAVISIEGASSVTVSDSVFLKTPLNPSHNTSSLRVSNSDRFVCRNCTFQDGGALSLESITLANISGSTFDSNYGGGMVAKKMGEVLISTTSFTGNIVEGIQGGGALSLSGADSFAISRSSFHSNVGGGVVASSVREMSIIGTTFSRNTVKGMCGGGAISMTEGNSVSVTASEFTSNSASYAGGAISIVGVNKVNVQDCEFLANSAINETNSSEGALGGGMYIKGANISTVASSQFKSNTAHGHYYATGGGLAVEDTTAASVTDCWFVFNSVDCTSPAAVNEGGGFGAMHTEQVRIADTAFWFNTAHGDASSGGGVLIDRTTAVDLQRCNFNRNSAAMGGAVALATRRGESSTSEPWSATGGLDSAQDFIRGEGSPEASQRWHRRHGKRRRHRHPGSKGRKEGNKGGSGQEAAIEISECNFLSNEAKMDGGAVWLNLFEGWLEAHSLQFRKNWANGVGGALYFGEGRGNVSQSLFTNNKGSQGGEEVASCGGDVAVHSSTFYRADLVRECTIAHGLVCCHEPSSHNGCANYSPYLEEVYSRSCRMSFLSCDGCTFRQGGIGNGGQDPWDVGDIM